MMATVPHDSVDSLSLTACPRVSVLMITYNHEAFIAQALDSVLMQETTFPYEVVIGDDCSTDGTREILKAYQRKAPERIRLLFPEQNLGPITNFARTLVACRGEYVAELEGDDYWISPKKLQQQADYLDAHPEDSCCVNHVRVLDVATGEMSDLWDRHAYTHAAMSAFIGKPLFHVNALMFRRTWLPPELAEIVGTVKNPDLAIMALLIDRGSMGYIAASMSIYRKHTQGIWTSLSAIERERNTISTWQAIDHMLNGRYHVEIMHRCAMHMYAIALARIPSDGCLQAVWTFTKLFLFRKRPHVSRMALLRELIHHVRHYRHASPVA